MTGSKDQAIPVLVVCLVLVVVWYVASIPMNAVVAQAKIDAAGGGLDIGPIASGDAPAEHYPGMGLNASRRLHEDARSAAAARIKELLRVFGGVLRAAQP